MTWVGLLMATLCPSRKQQRLTASNRDSPTPQAHFITSKSIGFAPSVLTAFPSPFQEIHAVLTSLLRTVVTAALPAAATPPGAAILLPAVLCLLLTQHHDD